jgi:ubiquinone/menaquinone biosynthesis C-methylase UbiE
MDQSSTPPMDDIGRVTRSKAAARASYDRMSRWYDALTGDSEKKYKDLGLKLLAVQPGERVLEIGCGTGKSLQALAQAAGATGRVHGLDLSEGMLAVAGERLRKAGLADRVDLKAGDAAALPFDEDTLDALFLSFTLELFDTPEIPRVLGECRRVLRPQGRLCVVGMSKLGKPNLMTRLYDWSHAKFPNAVDCRPIYVQAETEAAGFRTVATQRHRMWGLPVEIIVANKQ